MFSIYLMPVNVSRYNENQIPYSSSNCFFFIDVSIYFYCIQLFWYNIDADKMTIGKSDRHKYINEYTL